MLELYNRMKGKNDFQKYCTEKSLYYFLYRFRYETLCSRSKLKCILPCDEMSLCVQNYFILMMRCKKMMLCILKWTPIITNVLKNLPCKTYVADKSGHEVICLKQEEGQMGSSSFKQLNCNRSTMLPELTYCQMSFIKIFDLGLWAQN